MKSPFCGKVEKQWILFISAFLTLMWNSLFKINFCFLLPLYQATNPVCTLWNVWAYQGMLVSSLVCLCPDSVKAYKLLRNSDSASNSSWNSFPRGWCYWSKVVRCLKIKTIWFVTPPQHHLFLYIEYNRYVK